jgi:hypothetical protein
MRRVVPLLTLLILTVAVAISGFLLAGCAAEPGSTTVPMPPAQGQDFLPVWMNELRHPSPPPCAPRDLTELMLGCR